MLRFILTRASLVVPTFIGITLLVFVLIRLIPGDPIETMAGERGIDPVRHEQLRKEYGFDQPVLVQYGYYLARLARVRMKRSMMSLLLRCQSKARWDEVESAPHLRSSPRTSAKQLSGLRGPGLCQAIDAFSVALDSHFCRVLWPSP